LIEPRWQAKKRAAEREVFHVRSALAGRHTSTDAAPSHCKRDSSREIGRSAGQVCFIAAAFLLFCLPTMPSQAGREKVHFAAKLDATYAATLFGFPIGGITWTIEVKDDRFTASASGETAGLLRIFAQGHGFANASGTVAGKRAVASNFLVSFTHDNATQRVEIAFSGGKAKEHVSPPRTLNPALVPLTDASRSDVVDPMTALMIYVPGSGDAAVPAACDHKVAVFDGHMRYDLRLTFERIEQVTAAAGYQGPAVVCGIHFIPLAGYDPNRYSIKYLQAERHMEIWLAPVGETRLMVPFRVSVPTPIGVGVLQATRFIWTRQTAGSAATRSN
jgi:Protein of unknown function (DUF3108)